MSKIRGMVSGYLESSLADLGWYDQRQHRLGLTSTSGLLILVWLLTMISLPIVNWTLGDAALTGGISLSVLIQLGAVLAILRQTWSWPRILLSTLIVAGVTWMAEAIGTATGLPFGEYVYTAKLQPQMAHVPLLIPLAWMVLLPSAWGVAYVIRGRRQGLGFVGLSALAVTAWDLFLDPQMVAWGLWTWTNPSGYFGIPWSNFFGWILTSAVITVLVGPKDLPIRPLLLIYGITWILESVGLFFFWGLPGPALVGFLVMGSLFCLAWTRYQAVER